MPPEWKVTHRQTNTMTTVTLAHALRVNYADILRYDSKSVKLMSEPFTRVESNHCLMWHKLAKNSSIFEKDQEEILCQPCKKMKSHLDQRVRAALKVTPEEKEARLEVSSRCPLSSLMA